MNDETAFCGAEAASCSSSAICSHRGCALGSFALRIDLGPLFIYYLPQAYWLVGVSSGDQADRILSLWPVPPHVGICQHSGA